MRACVFVCVCVCVCVYVYGWNVRIVLLIDRSTYTFVHRLNVIIGKSPKFSHHYIPKRSNKTLPKPCKIKGQTDGQSSHARARAHTHTHTHTHARARASERASAHTHSTTSTCFQHATTFMCTGAFDVLFIKQKHPLVRPSMIILTVNSPEA